MYQPKYFSIAEYVPEEVYLRRGEFAWELLDVNLLILNDELRHEFGPMVINTWHSAKLQAAYGLRQWSGLRTAEFYRQEGDSDLDMYRRYDRSFSQYKYGRASDALFKDVSAKEVRDFVLRNPHRFPLLRSMEDDVSWFHGDVRNCNRLKVFVP